MPSRCPSASTRRPHRTRWLAVAAACVLAGLANGAAAGEAREVRDSRAPAAGQPAAAAQQQAPARTAADAKPEAALSAKAAPVALRVPAGDQRGPDVTLIAGEERVVYEYRQHGRLHMIKVVPKFGRPYYLAPRDPTQGFGDLEQADSLIAQWVLHEF